MAYTISPNELIKYSANDMKNFYQYHFDYIDNLLFTIPPHKLFGSQKSSDYIEMAENLFKKMGWDGDGEIELMWIPPFVFPNDFEISPVGLIIWHVKQWNDGISWLLSPIQLPFDMFHYQNTLKQL